MNLKRKEKILIFLFFLIVFMIVLLYFKYNFSNFNISESANSIKKFIESMGILAPLFFVLIYFGVSMSGISALPLTVLAGTLFGLFEGLLYVIIATTLSGSFSFYIARYFRRFLFKKKNKERKGVVENLINKIEDNAYEKGFSVIFILRMSLVPYILLSYASGLVKTLRFRDYILATIITNIIINFVLILFGFSITQNLGLAIISIVLAIGLFLLIQLYIRRKKMREV